MRRSISTVLGAVALVAAAAVFMQASAQTPAASNKSGVNIGSLNCSVAGGMGFIFGSSKALECTLTRTDNVVERYQGTVKKYGVDIGFTKESRIVWLVFAPGNIAPGAVAGDYGGVTAEAALGLGVGANVLLGGSSKQVTLQPVSVEGGTGLNIAAGIAAVELISVK
jgi:Protein of unknown function (DUF992)